MDLAKRMTSERNRCLEEIRKKKQLELLVLSLLTCKTGMDKNEPKLLEKEKLQMQEIDKIALLLLYKIVLHKRFQ